MRKFEAKKAVRGQVPLLIGLMGPSGGGKTYSALRLATGIQRVSGGDIYLIDTEARRSLHYAEAFSFQHIEFGSPFGPLDYLEAIEYAAKQGAKTIVIDSASHEHEGPGGVLEQHQAEVARLGGGAKNNFPAWAKPKAARRRLINTILQMQCNFIFCFRAKEKSKPAKRSDGKGDLQDMGWMPIAGEEFVYEMTACALLLPGANGVPTWNPDREGERQMVKLPEQFRQLFMPHRGALDEDLGESMARWAAGGEAHEFRFPKGEHAGKTMAEVPTDYLEKLLGHPKTSNRMRDMAGAELARRAPDDDVPDFDDEPVDDDAETDFAHDVDAQ